MLRLLKSAGLTVFVVMLGLTAIAPARAALVKAEFTASSGWFSTFTPPFGLSFSPTINGEVVFDNTKTGPDAFVSISYATGSKSWDVSQINTTVTAFTSVTFDPAGLVTSFGFYVIDSADYSIVSTNNSVSIVEGSVIPGLSNSMGCNGCVSFVSSFVNVPEPATLALLGTGLLGLAAVRRRRPSII